MRRLATEALPVTLAVSLHAPDDELRETLVPLNRRYPIADVLDAAADVAGAHGRRVSFEYAAIAGINDRPDQAEALGRLLAGWPGCRRGPRERDPAQPHGRHSPGGRRRPPDCGRSPTACAASV